METIRLTSLNTSLTCLGSSLPSRFCGEGTLETSNAATQFIFSCFFHNLSDFLGSRKSLSLWPIGLLLLPWFDRRRRQTYQQWFLVLQFWLQLEQRVMRSWAEALTRSWVPGPEVSTKIILWFSLILQYFNLMYIISSFRIIPISCLIWSHFQNNAIMRLMSARVLGRSECFEGWYLTLSAWNRKRRRSTLSLSEIKCRNNVVNENVICDLSPT